jgi:hypothetical protein
MVSRACCFVFFMAPVMICAPIPYIFACLNSNGSISVLIGTIFSFLSSILYLFLVRKYLSAYIGDYTKSSFCKRWSLIGLFNCICFGLQVGLQLSNDCSFEVDYTVHRLGCREWGWVDGGDCGSEYCCRNNRCLEMKTLGLILTGLSFALPHLVYLIVSCIS